MTTDAVPCPKHMAYGPCAGVAADGTCEVGPLPCTFLEAPVRRWEGIIGAPTPPPGPRTPEALATYDLLESGGVVIADLPARALDGDSLRACARALVGSVDITLAGDAPDARVQFPPSLRAAMLKAEGMRVWTGVNARDRNRVAIEAELAALAEVGVDGVHCVTGDHTATGHRADAMPVFDLDAPQIAALARAAGHLTSVAASPAVPPVAHRLPLVLEKERAGADVCFVDHCGGPAVVADFVARARAAGSLMRFIACVPAVFDAGSAELLASFPGITLPDGYLASIARAADPRAAGIEASRAMSAAMLEIDGVAGVDLSGGPTAGRELEFAEALAEVGSSLR
ncbi:methylenetetrahydrofolate reductase C-terminal domain-containing protein [Demequina zhanjiangensis]|uniref:Methylenetetrahydrofolate reductase C-terminal domain-containing protein n=1 Tax=Demequina zhanjiangensis TaxID=3051659 RepID=A0ABT8G3T0_9MICO|nr:methylenetetrahydrofolate reductase C-terminal domain-containing protein [Demequina sp. SYSU T00b26]MDN4473786.1 methylenetetrahydrofolate reductase C-terminal domain-containing protein [Demequina sp. SYSU T00b26]